MYSQISDYLEKFLNPNLYGFKKIIILHSRRSFQTCSLRNKNYAGPDLYLEYDRPFNSSLWLHELSIAKLEAYGFDNYSPCKIRSMWFR